MKLFRTPVLLLLLSSTALASTLRGGADPLSPFSCSLSAFDEDSCTSSQDDNGTPCVWCSVSSGVGICVSKEQYDAMGGICNADDDDKPVPDDDTAPDDDTTPDDDKPAPDDDKPAPDDDTPAPDDDFWDCLKSMDQAHCSCTWCMTKAGFGVCLNDEAVKDAEGSYWVDCSGTVGKPIDDVANPLDPQCLAAGMGSDDAQSVCDATLDSDGTPCVWCDVAGGYGLCLSSDAADSAGKYLTCDKSAEDSSVSAVKSPLDPTCVVAGFNGDDAEGTCHDTQDMDGIACVWCVGPSPNMGVCLSSDQAQMASHYLTCDMDNNVVEPTETAVKSPLDPTCIVAGLNGDDAEGTCHDTQDMDGTPCVWCVGPSPDIGVCLSSEQADMASQWLTCDSTIADLDIQTS